MTDNLKKFSAMEGNQSKELTLQHARLMEKVEDLPPGTVVSPEVCAEIKRLQTDLYKRLYRYMKSNILPIKVPAPSKKDLEFIEHQEICQKQIEEAVGLKISFNFEVFSSLNTRIDKFKIEATTKKKAMVEAQTRADKYPGRVKIKIS